MRLPFGQLRGVIHGDELHCVERLGPAQLNLAHVAHVKDADARAHGDVLGNQAGVFDRHIPAAEIDHLGASWRWVVFSAVLRRLVADEVSGVVADMETALLEERRNSLTVAPPFFQGQCTRQGRDSGSPSVGLTPRVHKRADRKVGKQGGHRQIEHEVLVLSSLMPGRAGAPDALRKKQREEREENACHLMPQHAPGMGQALPEGLAGASAFRSYHPTLGQIGRCLLPGDALRLFVNLILNALGGLTSSAAQFAAQSDISHDKKSVAALGLHLP